jgi:hypothetical protein
MLRQPQGPSKQEILATDSVKFDPRELNKSSGDAKSRVSSPISNSPSAAPQSSSIPPQNSSSSVTPISAVGGYSGRSEQLITFLIVLRVTHKIFGFLFFNSNQWHRRGKSRER